MLILAEAPLAAASAAVAVLREHAERPDWMCGVDAAHAVPQVAELEAKRGTEALVVGRDGGKPVAFATVRKATGRLRWVLTTPEQYTPFLDALGPYCAQRWTVRAWAWNVGENERAKEIRANPNLRIVEERRDDDGVLVMRVEWAGDM